MKKIHEYIITKCLSARTDPIDRRMTTPDPSLIAVAATLSEPTTALVNRAADALGGLAAPWQIKRVEKAKADAATYTALKSAETDLAIAAMQERAAYRTQMEQALHQMNIESVVQQAIPLLDDSTAKPEDIETDWMINFLDKTRLVTDSEMQNLWARILAGEANSPGRFSRRTVNHLADFDKDDANKFSKVAPFFWNVVDIKFPLIFDTALPIYKNAGIILSDLIHLQSIGILEQGDHSLKGLTGNLRTTYFGRSLDMRFTKPTSLPIGKFLLTKMGQEIATLCEAKPIPEFYDFIAKVWESFSSVKGASPD